MNKIDKYLLPYLKSTTTYGNMQHHMYERRSLMDYFNASPCYNYVYENYYNGTWGIVSRDCNISIGSIPNFTSSEKAKEKLDSILIANGFILIDPKDVEKYLLLV